MFGNSAMLSKLRGKSGTFRQDFLASIVVFLVALPLCLGIALACGAPPMLGLVTGIVGGLVVGVIAGSPLQVSGPAAGLVALIYEIIVQYKLEGLGIIVLLAGLMQLAAGVFRLGQWFRAISPAVIQGMLAGIGILIVVSQFHVMLDVPPESTGLANILSIPATVMKGLFPMDNTAHHLAAMLGIMTIATILLWNLTPRRLRVIPGTLTAVLLAVAVSNVTGLPVNYVEVPGGFLSVISLPTIQSLGLLKDPHVWVLAATIAIVASAETMLSAAAVDKMHDGPQTRYDQEMVAQGIGNTICGFLGAIPMTGVIVRSSVNITAGAKTRLSTILHGAWLLGLVCFFPFLLEKIPTASLAAILVFTGYKLVQPAAVKKLWQQDGWSEVLIYGVTVVMVVFTNLLEGVIAGSILSIFKLLFTLSRLEGRSVAGEGSRVDLMLSGSATFLSLPKLADILARQPLGKELHVHVEDLVHIDHACLEVLQNWQNQYARSGGRIVVEWHQLTTKMNGNGDGNGGAITPAIAEASTH